MTLVKQTKEQTEKLNSLYTLFCNELFIQVYFVSDLSLFELV